MKASKAATSPVRSQDAFRKHACRRSQGETGDFESAPRANSKPLGDDLSNHNVAAGMWVYHHHQASK